MTQWRHRHSIASVAAGALYARARVACVCVHSLPQTTVRAQENQKDSEVYSQAREIVDS